MQRVGKALEMPEIMWSEREILDEVLDLVAAHKQMAGRLQTAVQQYHLGLGGEPVDLLVIQELQRLRKNANA